MKLNPSIIMLLAVLTTTMVASAQEIGIDLLKQMMAQSSENLTTYNYSRFAVGEILYTNASVQAKFDAVKATEGKVDLVNQSGWWSSKLTDKKNGETLTWDDYFVNGTEYSKMGQIWTRLAINDTARMMEAENEIPGQVNLIKYSNVKLLGLEKFQGEDSYKLTGSPIGPVYRGLIGLQLLAAYIPSPFPLPDKLKNQTLDINSTSLMNNSRIILTAWISKDGFLLRRLDINSSLTITPQILNISSPDYMIESRINESTVYNDFGSLLNIEVPTEAQNAPSRFNGTVDWRWAVFGSARP
jgi:hypothetical protein